MSKIRLKKPLTPRQREVFDFIESFITEVGYPPTLTEIGARFRFSEKAASDHVNALERKGVIVREDGKPRSIRLTSFARLFSLTAQADMNHLGIEAGDLLTVSPAEIPVEGDRVLTTQGTPAQFKEGLLVVGKIVGLSRPL